MALNINSAAVSAFNRALTIISTLETRRRNQVLAGFNNAAATFINVPTPFTGANAPSSGGKTSDGGRRSDAIR